MEPLRSRFAGFGGPVPQVLARLTDPAALLHDDLRELVERMAAQPL